MALCQKSDKESPPCRPGRVRKSPSLEAEDPAIETGLDKGLNAEVRLLDLKKSVVAALINFTKSFSQCSE